MFLFGLLPNKRGATYAKMLEVLTEAVEAKGPLHLKQIMLDFEASVIRDQGHLQQAGAGPRVPGTPLPELEKEVWQGWKFDFVGLCPTKLQQV